ncbi:MAG: TetR/AcrR family transcriptional regulator [Desulfobulbus sp.]|jgi:TetR/AcrR family fatty acid metabolism transcriptional regulator
MKSQDKHSKIIRAATKVFAKKGFYNARIADIAKEAKVADGTIYLYFTNKFDILLSVFEQEIGKLIGQITHLLEKETDPRAKLEVFIAAHLDEMKKNRHLAEVMHVELRQASKLMREYRKNTFNDYLELIASIIRQGQEDGIFRPEIEPVIAMQMIYGALDEISRCWHVGSNDCAFTPEEVSSQLSQIILRGIMQTPAD